MNISKKSILALAIIGSGQIFCATQSSNSSTNYFNLESAINMYDYAQEIFNNTKKSDVAIGALKAMDLAKERINTAIIAIANDPKLLVQYIPQSSTDATKLVGRVTGGYAGYKAGAAAGSAVGKATGTTIGATGGAIGGGYAGYQLTKDDANKLQNAAIAAAAGTVAGAGIGNVAGDAIGSALGAGLGTYLGYKGGEALADYLLQQYLSRSTNNQ